MICKNSLLHLITEITKSYEVENRFKEDHEQLCFSQLCGFMDISRREHLKKDLLTPPTGGKAADP